jgi:hypothetical protein
MAITQKNTTEKLPETGMIIPVYNMPFIGYPIAGEHSFNAHLLRMNKYDVYFVEIAKEWHSYLDTVAAI